MFLDVQSLCYLKHGAIPASMFYICTAPLLRIDFRRQMVLLQHLWYSLRWCIPWLHQCPWPILLGQWFLKAWGLVSLECKLFREFREVNIWRSNLWQPWALAMNNRCCWTRRKQANGWIIIMKSCTLHAKKKVIQRNPISKFTNSFKSLTLGPSVSITALAKKKKQRNILALSRVMKRHEKTSQARTCSKRYPDHQTCFMKCCS